MPEIPAPNDHTRPKSPLPVGTLPRGGSAEPTLSYEWDTARGKTNPHGGCKVRAAAAACLVRR